MRRLPEEAALGIAGVDREHRPAPAALQGPIAIPAIGQEKCAIRQQERTESALVRVGRGDRPLFQQPGEVVLGQVHAALASCPLRRISA